MKGRRPKISYHFFAWLPLTLSLAGCTDTANISLPIADETLLKHATSLYQQGNFHVAQIEAEQVMKSRQYRGLGLALAGQCLNAQGDYTSAEPLGQDAVEALPDIANGHAVVAEASANTGEGATAELEARAALKLPESPLLPTSRSEQHLSLANALCHQDKVPLADPEYKLAIEADPKNALAYRDYGVMLNRCGRYREAADELRHASELLPKDNTTLIELVRALINTNSLSEATEDNSRLSALMPGDPLVSTMQAEILWKAKNNAAAESKCNEILQSHKDFGPAYIVLANVLIAQNKIPEAEQAAIKAAQSSPENPLAQMALARALGAQQKWVSAEFALSAAKQLAPFNKVIVGEADALNSEYSGNVPKVKIRSPGPQ